MPNAETLLVSMEFTTAARSHRCGFNRKHRLGPGTARLTIRNSRIERHYCLQCATTLLRQAAGHLRLLIEGASDLARFPARPEQFPALGHGRGAGRELLS